MNRIVAAFFNSMRALRRSIADERAVRQECLILVAGVGLAPFVARSLPHAAVLIGVLLMVIAIELLNTAVEKLADHVAPERSDAVGYAKDLGSAAVFCALAVSALVWFAALVERMLPAA